MNRPNPAALLLDRGSFPMRLWEKAKKHGTWNPSDVDFTADIEDWQQLSAERKQRLLQLFLFFKAGEEAVTLDFLPLIHTVAAERRIEEEIYLTSFLWEEAKHFDLFNRFLSKIEYEPADVGRISPAYERLIGPELQESIHRLSVDKSPAAQVRAAVTYNMVIEGIMAETGYYLFRRILNQNAILPGMQHAINLIQRDESRHIAFGIYFISRIIAEHGNCAYRAFLDRMWELKPLVEAARGEFLAHVKGDDPLHGQVDDVLRFCSRQFTARMSKILRARSEGRNRFSQSSRNPASRTDPG